MKHKFVPRGGLAENPGVYGNHNGGLEYIDECSCGIVRHKGVDTTGARPGNNWGPHYYNAKGERLARIGSCPRGENAANEESE